MAARTGATAREKDALAVASALQRYADRGVLRALSIEHGRAGRLDCRFVWLTRVPMVVAYDPPTATVTFKDLLPSGDGGMFDAVKALVRQHHTAAVPEHRRIDGRRVALRCTVRRARLSVSLVVKGSNHGYAVQRGLNLVNQVFLHLQQWHPEYLVERFGLSPE